MLLKAHQKPFGLDITLPETSQGRTELPDNDKCLSLPTVGRQ